MRTRQVNRVTGTVMLALSFLALLTVLTGYLQPRQPAPVDEGAAAHIFQISVVALGPLLLLFVGTADWRQPRLSARPMAAVGVVLGLAFVALYCLEHFYFQS